MKRFKIAHFSEIEPVNCPCGKAHRAFAEPDNPVASVHIAQIEREAETHYH